MSAVLYFWDSPDAKYGDKYDWSCSVVWLDHETVEFHGVCKEMTLQMWREIKDAFYDMGVKRIKALRLNTGEHRVRWIETYRRRRQSENNGGTPST